MSASVEVGSRSPKRNLLFIENSDGLGGSTISLATLLSAVDPEKYCSTVALSRNVQLQYLREHFVWPGSAQVVACGRNVRLWSGVAALAGAIGKTSRGAERSFVRAVSSLDFPFVILPYVLRLWRLARAARAELIHHNNGFDISAIILKWLLGVPLVAYQRGWEWDSLTVRRLGNCVDRYVANSQTIRQHLIDLGIEPGRIEVIYPPIDLARFDPAIRCARQRQELGLAEGAPCFGVVGALLEYRGQHVFLRAAARVMRVVPNARAVIVGDAPGNDTTFKQRLVAMAEELGIGPQVVFTGHRTDVPEVMQLLDVVVHPALISEPFGRVIAEAMAMAKPVVATEGGGPRELIREGETGFVVARADDEALAAKIIDLLRDRTRARAMGQRGCNDARELCNPARHAQCMGSIYDGLLGTWPARSAVAACGGKPELEVPRRHERPTAL